MLRSIMPAQATVVDPGTDGPACWYCPVSEIILYVEGPGKG